MLKALGFLALLFVMFVVGNLASKALIWWITGNA